jgi:hypothetical protein
VDNQTPHRAPTALEAERRRRWLRHLLPILLVLGMLALIASRELPWLADWIARITAPQRWQAGESCRTAALKLATQPDYARIVAPGTVHATQRGFYVENIVVGQMGANGSEQRLSVNCYADSNGNMVSVGANVGRESPPTR